MSTAEVTSTKASFRRFRSDEHLTWRSLENTSASCRSDAMIRTPLPGGRDWCASPRASVGLLLLPSPTCTSPLGSDLEGDTVVARSVVHGDPLG